MFERIVELIQQALRPYDDQHAYVLAKLEDLERRQRNIVQPGRVIAIHPDGGLIKVQYGENQTPYIRWFTPSAGGINEYRCPSIDEQCVLINHSGGNNSTQAWVLCGVWSDKYPAPTDKPHLHVVEYPDGSVVEHDTQTGNHSLKIKGDLILDIEGRIIEQAVQHIANKR